MAGLYLQINPKVDTKKTHTHTQMRHKYYTWSFDSCIPFHLIYAHKVMFINTETVMQSGLKVQIKIHKTQNHPRCGNKNVGYQSTKQNNRQQSKAEQEQNMKWEKNGEHDLWQSLIGYSAETNQHGSRDKQGPVKGRHRLHTQGAEKTMRHR